MRSFGRIAAVAGLALMSPIAPAIAADVGAQYYEMAGTPYEFASGWYLRGDIGYTIYSTPSASFDAPGYGNMKDESLTNTGVAGFGFGYQLERVSQVGRHVRLSLAGGLPRQAPLPGAVHGRSRSRILGRVREHRGLDHAVQRLLRHRHLEQFHALCRRRHRNVLPHDQRRPLSQSERHDGQVERCLGVELRLGAARSARRYALNNNWLIDANYRYVDMGDAVSGKTLSSFKNKPIHYDNIDAQELRIGLRYLIN